MSLAGNMAGGPDPERAARVGHAYLLLVGALAGTALGGLLCTLLAKPEIS
jgi:hypothetical protein